MIGGGRAPVFFPGRARYLGAGEELLVEQAQAMGGKQKKAVPVSVSPVEHCHPDQLVHDGKSVSAPDGKSVSAPQTELMTTLFREAVAFRSVAIKS